MWEARQNRCKIRGMASTAFGPHRDSRLRWCWQVALAVSLAWQAVGAEPTGAELNKARAQFQQGLALETAGDWAGALALFQDVASVKMTPQVRFNIALCEEHLGRLAIALGDYKLALAEAEAAKVTVVAEQVPSRIELLRARVPKVRVRRAAGAEFATILLDGVVLGAASIGKDMPVDPGPHTIEARAPGFNLFMNSFNIGERESKTLDVTLARAAPPAEVSAASSVAPPAPSQEPAPALAPAAGRSPVPFIVGGVGVAGLIASGVFYAMRSSALSDLDKVCGRDRNECPPGWESTYDDAKTYTTLSAASLAVGAVGVGAGIVLYVAGMRSEHKPATTTEVTLGGAGSPWGIKVVGQF